MYVWAAAPCLEVKYVRATPCLELRNKYLTGTPCLGENNGHEIEP